MPDETKARGAPILPWWAALLVLASVMGLGAAAALRLETVEDISALLPGHDEDSAKVADLAREWGLMKKVIIVVGPGEPGSTALFRAADEITLRLEGMAGVHDVVSVVDAESAKAAAQMVMDRGPRLYRPRGRSFDGPAVAERLADLKERLAAPEALVMQEYLLADPLGMSRDGLLALSTAGAGLGAAVDRGRLVSADGRYALVLATLDFDPMDVTRATTFAAELDRRIADGLAAAGPGETEAFALGGVHYAATSSSAIMGDVRLAFVLTGLGVILVFLLFFRRVAVLIAALIPGAFGIAVAIAVMWLAGVRLHALTIGFAATITGLSIDYAIHLLHRSLCEDGATTRERMRRAVAAIVRPLLLGCATTALAFGLVATSELPGMRQLALFSAISLPVSLAATLLLLPAFHGALLRGDRRRSTLGERLALAVMSVGGRSPRPARRVAIGAVFAALAILAGIGAAFVPRSGDPRDLGYEDPELARREATLRALFGGLIDQTLLVSSGATLDAALEANDRLYDALVFGGIDSGRVVSVSPILPSLARQERSLEAARGVLEDPETKRRFIEAGFREKYVASLAAREVLAITASDYAGTGLGRLIEDAVVRDKDTWRVLTRVGGASREEVEALVEIASRVDGCFAASERLEAEAMLETMVEEIARMLGIWLLVAMVLLGVAQRDPLFGPVASIPAVLGVLGAVGMFYVMGRPITPVASAGLTLVMGLGVDYGIFAREKGTEAAAAVLASALTTLAAFGVLSCAETKAMADIGLITLFGISISVVAALVLLPAIPRRRAREEGRSR